MPLLFNYKFNFSSCYPTFLSTIVDKQRGSIRLFNEKSRRYNFILIKSCQTFTITPSYAIYVGQQVSSSVLLLGTNCSAINFIKAINFVMEYFTKDGVSIKEREVWKMKLARNGTIFLIILKYWTSIMYVSIYSLFTYCTSFIFPEISKVSRVFWVKTCRKKPNHRYPKEISPTLKMLKEILSFASN